MSSLWAEREGQAAAALPGVGAFAGMTARGRFQTRFSAAGAAGWTATGTGAADRVGGEAALDPVEQASRDGFVAGFQEGERVARETVEADDLARLALAAAIGQVAGAGEGALAALLSQAVLRLVTQIVGEVPVDEARLAERCAAVAHAVDPADGKAVLEVHPDDLPLIPTDGIVVPLAPNPALSRGSVRLATAEGWIEDGPDVRLDRLRALFDDMEGRL